MARRLLGELAPTVVVAMAALVVVAELARWVDWPFLSSVAWSRVVLTAAVALVVVTSLRGAAVSARGSAGSGERDRGSRTGATDRSTRLLAGWAPAVPALVLTGYAVVSRFQSGPGRWEWFLGGDSVRHVVMTAAERSTGFLDYSVEPYPRAWHTLMACVWSATGAHGDAAGLLSLVDLLSTGIWLLYALLSLATGLTAQALGARCGLPARSAALCGLVAAALTLVPTLISNYLVLGLHSSVVGALLLAVTAREVVVRPATRRAVVVTGSCVLVMAHTWQLLLPAAALGFALVALAQLRPGLVGAADPGRRTGSGGASAAWVGGTVLVAAASAVPSLAAVATKVGIQHATDAGVDAPVPFVLLTLALVSSVVLLVRRRRDLVVVTVALAVLGTALSGPLLAARVGISPTTYYPSKLLWHAAVLGLAPTAVLGGRLMGMLESRAKGAARVLWLGAGAAIGAVVLGCLANPLIGASGAWPSPHGAVVLRAVTTPRAADAQVVWTGDGADDTISRILLDYYRVAQTPARTAQGGLDVATECQLLSESDAPAVLSTRDEPDVRARYACAPDVQRIPVRPDLPRQSVSVIRKIAVSVIRHGGARTPWA
ncbi:hypothetical protein SAMN04489867_1898 [Pedococcus dokdonensis]|uniref:Uncharacterized protein n=1 Tax=Pedococcus dokdonensis TaxID=443156 RepID=A0A1H0RAC8_9MICO|nr:hypothetical protein SAMN04489867_1898 [Pedococcus dokdonensis]